MQFNNCIIKGCLKLHRTQRLCERGREDEDNDGEQRVNAIELMLFFIFLFLIRRINDLVTNF